MSDVNWGNYAEAYKTIHDKLDEIFEQLSVVKDAAKYLPVRLTDGTNFYTAGGGAGGGLVQVQIRNEADDAWINEPYARDVLDRANRLLGRVYGSQGQQILQRATTYDLIVQLRHNGAEIDPRQIRALTSSDVVDVSDRSARDLGHLDVDNFPSDYPLPSTQVSDLKNVTVVSALPAGDDNIGDVDVVSLESAVAASDAVVAVNNTSGLTVSMNNNWRTLVQFRATLGGAGEIHLDASPDGVNYFNLWSKSLSEAGSYCDWDFCAFPYFRVRVPTTGIDIAIDIRAVKS